MNIDRITPISRYLLKRDYDRLTRANQRKLIKHARTLSRSKRRDTQPLRTRGATGPLS